MLGTIFYVIGVMKMDVFVSTEHSYIKAGNRVKVTYKDGSVVEGFVERIYSSSEHGDTVITINNGLPTAGGANEATTTTLAEIATIQKLP
jgi:hypothetical protein